MGPKKKANKGKKGKGKKKNEAPEMSAQEAILAYQYDVISILCHKGAARNIIILIFGRKHTFSGICR